MNLFDFWEPLVKCAPCIAGSFHSNVIMFMLSLQCFLSIILCQCSSAIYGFTTKSSSPIMIPIACLLASSFTHSVLLISPSFHEWVVGEILPLCVLSPWLQHWWGAPQECSIMWHSLVCSRPHHSFLTWVVVLSSWFFFSPKKVRRNQREWIGLPQIQSCNKVLF